MNPSALGISDAIIPRRMLSNYFIMHNKCKIFILVYIIILKMYAIYSQSCKASFTSHILHGKVHLWNSCCFAGLALWFTQLLNLSYLWLWNIPIPLDAVLHSFLPLATTGTPCKIKPRGRVPDKQESFSLTAAQGRHRVCYHYTCPTVSWSKL